MFLVAVYGKKRGKEKWTLGICNIICLNLNAVIACHKFTAYLINRGLNVKCETDSGQQNDKELKIWTNLKKNQAFLQKFEK